MISRPSLKISPGLSLPVSTATTNTPMLTVRTPKTRILSRPATARTQTLTARRQTLTKTQSQPLPPTASTLLKSPIRPKKIRTATSLPPRMKTATRSAQPRLSAITPGALKAQRISSFQSSAQSLTRSSRYSSLFSRARPLPSSTMTASMFPFRAIRMTMRIRTIRMQPATATSASRAARAMKKALLPYLKLSVLQLRAASLRSRPQSSSTLSALRKKCSPISLTPSSLLYMLSLKIPSSILQTTLQAFSTSSARIISITQ